MTTGNIIKGLQIIEQCRPEGACPYHVRAEHDNIIAGSLEWLINEPYLSELEELGWQAIEEYDGFLAIV